MPDRPDLTLDSLRQEAAVFARRLSETPIPELHGVDNGKTVGTYLEAEFNKHVLAAYEHEQGNAAKGIDFPALDVDLKTTSIKQPQSSCPFRDATQKVYGLGYHLLVFVYEKVDDHELQAARLDIRFVIFVDRSRTADFQMTTGLQAILDNEGNADDIDAFLEEKNLPLDDIGRRTLAQRILNERPDTGYLTISNALQWRLQYARSITAAANDEVDGVEDLLAE